MTDDSPGGWLPRPDPTLLTTAQLDREIAHLKELNNLHLELIERQRVESKADNQRELNAALVAAKESVNSFKEAYDLGHSALLISMDAIRQRLTAIEATALGSSVTRSEGYDQRKDSRAAMALYISIGNAVLLILMTVINEIVVHLGH